MSIIANPTDVSSPLTSNTTSATGNYEEGINSHLPDTEPAEGLHEQ